MLATMLGAKEPQFRLRLRELELLSGSNKTDIRLSVEVAQAVKHKIRSLHLDPSDTTGEELYHALNRRVTEDDVRMERLLRTVAATHVSAEADLNAGMAHTVRAALRGRSAFVIKNASLKRLLKSQPTVQLHKALGVRSADALLRQESPVMIATFALQVESATWQRKFLSQYKKLLPGDFEARSQQLLVASNTRWSALGSKLRDDAAHTVLSRPELGTIVLLPLEYKRSHRKSAEVIATMSLALHESNEVATASTWLKASQVSGEFGDRIFCAAHGQIMMPNEASQPHKLSWSVVQQYVSKVGLELQESVYGPHVIAADFHWKEVGAQLASIAPFMHFWQDTQYMHYAHLGTAVSCNVIDAAFNACNDVEYSLKNAYHGQRALWHELSLRYIDPASLEFLVARALQPVLVEQTESIKE